ncbi:MAG: DUF5615 family PIN-like protein [Saprospiraceae bacterium]|jgi:predicted nuclease of predicted toxin-antitoxin system|nr:DUF5615 family PIN-like protein [Saprospiraceae bacterium]
MAKLYSNENFDVAAVAILRTLGHEVLTTTDTGMANQKIPDDEVLAFAQKLGFAVVTFNYQDFRRLHLRTPGHFGIIICSHDKDATALANRIHAAIAAEGDDLQGKLLRINRPNPSAKP